MGNNKPLLDLTAQGRERDHIVMPDGEPAFLVDQQQLGPRDFAKILTAGQRAMDLDVDDLDAAALEDLEHVMTDAACLVLPDEPRERVDELPYFSRAQVVQAFVRGLPEKQQGRPQR